MNQFRRWLRSQIAYLDKLADQDELADVDFDDAGRIITEASRRAAMLGFGQWSRYVATEQLAPERAREILAEMIAATEKGRTAEPVSDDAPMTVEQAARRLNLGKRTVYRLVETGELQADRTGRAIRITPQAIAEYLARSQGPRAGLFA